MKAPFGQAREEGLDLDTDDMLLAF